MLNHQGSTSRTSPPRLRRWLSSDVFGSSSHWNHQIDALKKGSTFCPMSICKSSVRLRYFMGFHSWISDISGFIDQSDWDFPEPTFPVEASDLNPLYEQQNYPNTLPTQILGCFILVKKLSVSQVPWNPSMFNTWNPKRMDLDVVFISFLMTLGLKSSYVLERRQNHGAFQAESPSWRLQIGFESLMAWCGHPIFVGWNYAPFAGLKKKLVDVGSNCADSKWEIHHGSQW